MNKIINWFEFSRNSKYDQRRLKLNLWLLIESVANLISVFRTALEMSTVNRDERQSDGSKVRNNMCLLFIYDFAISIKLIFSGFIEIASHLIKQNFFFAYLYDLMIECFFFP